MKALNEIADTKMETTYPIYIKGTHTSQCHLENSLFHL